MLMEYKKTMNKQISNSEEEEDERGTEQKYDKMVGMIDRFLS